MSQKNLEQVLIKFENGTDIAINYRSESSDRDVINQIWGSRDYDLRRLQRHSDIRRYYENTLQKGRTPLIIDAGANIGASSLFFSTNFPESFVVAIEPEESNFNLLQVNSSQADNIECLNRALSSESTELLLIDPGEKQWGYRTISLEKGSKLGGSSAVSKIKGISIPDILKGKGINFEPFIVKIDIEGGEDEVFSKNTNWMERTPLVIIELHDWLLPRKSTSRNFIRTISQLD
ncbi:FkbM family methyltransferase [Methylobacterium sp. CCH5-D2]|nr:FkbM family methyltransferase [Methylobacterium sp. CCH5-D2]